MISWVFHYLSVIWGLVVNNWLLSLSFLIGVFGLIISLVLSAQSK